MDATVVRRFAVGPFATADGLATLAIAPAPVSTQEADWQLAPHALLEAEDGLWLCTADPALKDRAAALLGTTYRIVTIDSWNAFSNNATFGKLRTEHHREGVIEIEWADRRYPDLSRMGMLEAVAAGWLSEHVRKLARPPRESRVSKKEVAQRETTERLVALLVERALVILTPDANIAQLAVRTRRILFTLSTARTQAIANLGKMLRDSQHVAEVRGAPDDLGQALDDVGYRRRAK